MTRSLYPQKPKPVQIYAYTQKAYADIPWENGNGKGWIKVGQTERDVHVRIKEQLGAGVPDDAYDLKFAAPAEQQGVFITDGNVHRALEQMGRRRVHAHKEWFEATDTDVEKAVRAALKGEFGQASGLDDFAMRPEQEEAVARTAQWFEAQKEEGGDRRFLWNAKMRFGKTFSTYKLAQRMGWKRILVLTYQPVVENSWRDDLVGHADFKGWTFIGNGDALPDAGMPERTVCLTSFQALGSKERSGKEDHRLDFLFAQDWDCIVLDEYHFGSWRNNARLSYAQGADSEEDVEDAVDQTVVETVRANIRAQHLLFLSGTPFRALMGGEFEEGQIFTWSYIDEQKAKESWDDNDGPNPYAALPRMVMMTYRLPDSILNEGDFGEKGLDDFFSAKWETKGGKKNARFVHHDAVKKWLRFLLGEGVAKDDLDHTKKGIFAPFQDPQIRDYLNHTFWYLPNVAACHAMAGLLANDLYFRDHKVVVAAGVEAGLGKKALKPVEEAIKDNKRTITLSCRKLTTGVTVPQWTGVFMLRSMKSPESYFQTAFRAQSPWETRCKITGAKRPVKQDAYVFDFDPSRTLTLVTEYYTQMQSRYPAEEDGEASDPIAEGLQYFPTYCSIDGSLVELDPREAVSIAINGTGTAMLARRFQSKRLLFITPETLRRLSMDTDLMASLDGLESFRNLRSNITAAISSAEVVDKAKAAAKEAGTGSAKDKQSPEVAKEEKDLKKAIEKIQEDLLKFIARLPLFMYLNDEREKTVLDVIATTDDTMFKKVTGITKKDFQKLLDHKVFNTGFMNVTIAAFKRLEDNALVYLGDRDISGATVALWNMKVVKDSAETAI